ncbi:MAG: hypothetical protein ACLFUR_03785 [Candidatus Hadarchaeia archaeon]
MPCHETHCRSCVELYGKPFSEVHRWMDRPVERLGPGHQKVRHDIAITPKRVAFLFGEAAEMAARDHILMDKKWGRNRG